MTRRGARPRTEEIRRFARNRDFDALAAALLTYPHYLERYAAAEALADQQESASFNALAQATRDEQHVAVRARAARSIPTAAADKVAAMNVLLRLLQDPEEAVKIAAARALAALGDARAVPELERLLDDPHQAVRLEAIEAIDAFPGPDADRAIERAQTDPRYLVRASAKASSRGRNRRG